MAVEFQRAGGSVGVTHTIDIGAAGNARLIVVFMDIEATYGASWQGTCSVDSKGFTQAVLADNPDGAGNHLEMHTIDEAALGSSNGSLQITFTGSGDWAIHVLVFYGVKDDTILDSEIENVVVGDFVEVENVSSNDACLVVMGAGQGGSGSCSGWTSPLTERTDSPPNPVSAVLGSASGIETTGQTNKTYSVTVGSGTYRATGIVAVFEPSGLSILPSGIASAEAHGAPAVRTFKLEGITYDKNGSALGSCHCHLFKDNLDDTLTYIGYALSNSSTGAYIFYVSDDDAQYLVVAWKDDTPHVFDVTDHVLQPVGV